MLRNGIHGALSLGAQYASTLLVARMAVAVGISLGGSIAQAEIDEIVVVAQRKEQTLQSVPIAASAFDGAALERLQISNFSDLQFNAPNVSFSKAFFNASNIQIRGIGRSVEAASADTGVGVHVNDVYLNSPRLFETEYYDLERVELLRGPQGTLYGRNATGGSVNMITHKPVMEQWDAKLGIQYGEYNHQQLKGVVNIPLGDRVAARLAGHWLQRDGFTETQHPDAAFKDYDGRDQWSMRFSLRFEPTDTTTIDLIASFFNEDDNRIRSAKQLCHNDPTALLGCLPDSIGFESSNFLATAPGVGANTGILGPLGLFPAGSNFSIPNPADLRKTYENVEPEYKADETLLMVRVEQDLGDHFVLHGLASVQESSVSSTQIYGAPVGIGSVQVPAVLALLIPNTYATYYADGTLPLSAINSSNSGLLDGSIFGTADGIQNYDRSTGAFDQWSVELRLASNFAGPWNFTVAGYYLDYKAEDYYHVISNVLDYQSLIFPILAGLPQPDGLAMAIPYFGSETPAYELQSAATFGELYWEPNDSWKFTLGLRYTQDKKYLKDRQLPLLSAGFVATGAGAAQATEALLAGIDADASLPGAQPYHEDRVEFNEFTGRLVVEYIPEWSFTDDTMLYASVSRGYKGGGSNPPVDPVLFQNVASSFQPEFLNAFEVGAKNRLFDGRLQANLTAFIYDYEKLQVGKLVNRISLNENIDAQIWGLEGEFVFAPSSNWLLNLNVSYLSTEIGDASSLDPRDPSNGEAGHVLIKSIPAGENCLVQGIDAATFTALTGTQTTPIPGMNIEGAFSSCDLLLQAGLPVIDGLPHDITGNELQNSPEFTVASGIQYSLPIGGRYNLAGRLDHYWQSRSFARVFNKPVDKIDSWSMWNAQLTLSPAEGRWMVQLFVQNLTDEDPITGHALGDPSTGLATHVFVLEPRVAGLNLNFSL